MSNESEQVQSKKEENPTPEERLLRAIFGEKAGDVKDVSLKSPSSMDGVVLDTKLFVKSDQDKAKIKKELEILKKLRAKNLLKLQAKAIEKLVELFKGEVSQGVYHKFGNVIINKGEKFTEVLIENSLFFNKKMHSNDGTCLEEKSLIEEANLSRWTTNEKKNKLLNRLVRNYAKARGKIIAKFKRESHH